MVWDVFDLNLLCRVSIVEILRFLELGFDCYCEWWCLFGFTQATLGLGRGRSRWIGSRHVLGLFLIYSSSFYVFCWYWLLFVLSLSFIWTGFWKFCSFRFIEMVWDVYDLNLLRHVSNEEILRFPELGFDCYCEWWCLFGFTQATLGLGTAEERSILQCNIGNKSTVLKGNIV